ncbi:hypothetical protein [Cognataquiflexum rubidum]|nr:hypothetical protein [Cognataquiflexum rubidum]MCH6234980.1 hypothetical protein [Cognataquiflexum rubidum]
MEDSEESDSFNSISYKANLLKVSTWSEEEIKDLEQNLEKFGKWQIENW